MAGKQEIKPGVVINYKEKLDDRFVDITTQKTTTEANNYLTQFNTNLHSENKQTVESVSPYYYYSKVRSGAKSPLSVEMAQHIFKNTLEALEDALRAEIARAFSSEKYLSDFMKENMVTKSEDQSISGFKDFNSVQIDHADIDTEIADDITTRHIKVTEDADIDRNANIGKDLHVSRNSQIDGNTNVGGSLNVDTGATINHSLRIPLTAPVSRVTGDIWYDPNITSPGGTSGGNTDTGKQVTVHQYSTNEVAMYDGSTHVATLTADNTVDKIILDDKTIKIPNGVILGNMNGSDSIELEKKIQSNSVKFSVKNQYIKGLADEQIASALVSVNQNIANLSNECTNIKNDIANINITTESLSSSISSVASSSNSRLDILNSEIRRLKTVDESFRNNIEGLSNSLTTLSTQLTNLENSVNGNESSSLKSRLESLVNDMNVMQSKIDTIFDRLDSLDESAP